MHLVYDSMVFRIMIEVDDKFEVDRIEKFLKKQFATLYEKGEPFYGFDVEEIDD